VKSIHATGTPQAWCDARHACPFKRRVGAFIFLKKDLWNFTGARLIQTYEKAPYFYPHSRCAKQSSGQMSDVKAPYISFLAA
jgi:hypothetical protein